LSTVLGAETHGRKKKTWPHSKRQCCVGEKPEIGTIAEAKFIRRKAGENMNDRTQKLPDSGLTRLKRNQRGSATVLQDRITEKPKPGKSRPKKQSQHEVHNSPPGKHVWKRYVAW